MRKNGKKYFSHLDIIVYGFSNRNMNPSTMGDNTTIESGEVCHEKKKYTTFRAFYREARK